MTNRQRVARAYQYVAQALELFHGVEGQVTVPPDAVGGWVSLLRNLESAEADLNAALKAPDA